VSDRATQASRVLRLLVKRGNTGLTQADFLPPRIADGGKPIARLASRIEELRNDHGVGIVSGGRRASLEVYVLADLATLPDLPPRLFDDDDA
jgi:hypothetical protein